MSTIQEQMLMYHALEVMLRDAAQANQPLTLRDIWEMPQAKQVFRTENQVRDKLGVLVSNKHKLAVKVPVAQSQTGDKRHRVAYMWADLNKTADEELNYKQAAAGASRLVSNAKVDHVFEPTPVATDIVEVGVFGLTVFAGKNVELHVSDVKCVVDKNPNNGRVRIKLV